MYTPSCGAAQLILTGVTNRLHFVDVIIVNDVIECGVELVEEVHHLVRGAGTRQLSEAHDITAISRRGLVAMGSNMSSVKANSPLSEVLLYIPEVDGGVCVALGLGCPTLAKIISHRFW